MLSILIPIYNFDVKELVKKLHKQASDLSIPFEIRCYDDDSYFQFKIANQTISQLPFVTYRELNNNIGRAKIRNKLAHEAIYENLLFLDCDSDLPNKKFLKKYVKQLPFTGVICGGRAYEKEAPSDKNLLLHWTYGSAREVSTAPARQKNKYARFQTNNFLVSKNIFETIKLDESIKGYGHEDTLFGIELAKMHVAILHINNPLIHVGLDDNAAFLNKSKEGTNNLAKLILANKINNSVKLYRAYKLIKRLGLSSLLLKRLAKKEPYFETELLKSELNLKHFDKLKLYWLLSALS